MDKYEVLISRTETTIYKIKVKSNTPEEAEKLAYERYEEGYWDYEEIVDGEEETHEINYKGEVENA